MVPRGNLLRHERPGKSDFAYRLGLIQPFLKENGNMRYEWHLRWRTKSGFDQNSVNFKILFYFINTKLLPKAHLELESITIITITMIYHIS